MQITIEPFEVQYQQQVENMVLSIQNGEFLLGITAQDQPDLPNIKAFYQDRGGQMWVAVDENNEVKGCTAYEKLDEEHGALRKMFMKPEMRGRKDIKLAQELYDTFLDFAKQNGSKYLWLDTPHAAQAAHRFYERNGWNIVPVDELPKSYKIPKIDFSRIKFYMAKV